MRRTAAKPTVTTKGRATPEAQKAAGTVARDDVEEIDEETPPGASVVKRPYDPSRTKIDTQVPTIDLLVKRLRHSEIDLSPSFQRKADLWNDQKKSRLIESLLIRIPLPAFYFDATTESRWLVIDGLQRLSTLRAFLIDKNAASRLRLTGLDYLQAFEGKTFDELPRDMQRRIEETQVTAHLIRPGTPPEIKYNIFRRINTDGLVLTPQEIRHALNQGPVVVFLDELAGSKEFRFATDGGVSSRRMLDREFSLRFCAFSLTPYREFKESSLDLFFTRAMATLNSSPKNDLAKLKQKFLAAMQAASEIFGKDAFRKRLRKEDPRRPINKALFEPWSVLLGALSETERKTILKRKNTLLEGHSALMKEKKFLDAITIATGDPAKVRTRFEKVEGLIRRTLAQRGGNA